MIDERLKEQTTMEIPGSVYVILIGVALAIFGCSAINEKLGLRNDNGFEEWAEEQIRQEIGLDIDLTPESPENV